MDILSKKWEILRRRAWPFKYIPFVDFVLVAGSIALGNAEEDSDFDVIVGARRGRVFTVRFFCWVLFGLLGWHAKHLYGSNANPLASGQMSDVSNKFCFNHFVTEKSYRLSPPYNLYWQKLYQNLAPIYGKHRLIEKFFKANEDWAGKNNNEKTINFMKRSFLKWFLELPGRGKVGDLLEWILRVLQVYKINKSIEAGALGYEPRIRSDENEIELHPDTKRIDEFLKNTSIKIDS